MGKRSKILYLRNQIMHDIYDINVLLDLITSYKIETFAEAMTLAQIALEKGKKIAKNNNIIGKILGC